MSSPSNFRQVSILRIFFLVVFLTGCASVPPATSPQTSLVAGDPSAPSQVTPQEAIAIAELYCQHAWRPFARNILHGPDPRGVRVDTPDAGYLPTTGRPGWWIPGAINVGIPYKWGGFDDPSTFNQKIANGQAAGDIFTRAKRRADNDGVSEAATGVDCSGFVSRCLKLPTVHDSSELPAVCDPVNNPHDLQPGDLLNIPRQHVMLVAGWARPDKSWIYFYETGGEPEWKPALKEAPLDKILALGFQPMRYRGMAREAVPSGKEILTRSMRSRAISLPNPTIGAP